MYQGCKGDIDNNKYSQGWTPDVQSFPQIVCKTFQIPSAKALTWNSIDMSILEDKIAGEVLQVALWRTVHDRKSRHLMKISWLLNETTL